MLRTHSNTGLSRVVVTVMLAVIVVLIAVLVYFMLTAPDEQATNDTTNTTPTANVPANQQTNQSTTPVTVTNATVTPVTGDDQDRLEQLARSFAERFGSYSSNAAYENIRNLKVLMTPSLQAWADRFVADAEQTATGEYYGVTTTAFTTRYDAYDADEGTATLTIGTQRREVRSVSAPATISTQDLRLVFTRDDGNWLVDEAEWL